ncbi:MAG: hypothetical protein WAU15_03475 [Nitrosomonas sp.]
MYGSTTVSNAPDSTVSINIHSGPGLNQSEALDGLPRIMQML